MNARGLIGPTSIISSPIPFAGMQNGGTINVTSNEHTNFAGFASVAPGPVEGTGGDITLSSDGLLTFTGTTEIGEAPRAGSLTLIEPEPESPDGMTEEIKQSVKVSLSEIASTQISSQPQQPETGSTQGGSRRTGNQNFGGLVSIGGANENGGEETRNQGLLCLHGVSEAACGNSN